LEQKAIEELTLSRTIQIKVCGLTEAKTAEECVALNIDAVGLVFYPKSPRHVSNFQAEEVSAAVNGRAAIVGVFVDEPVDFILEKALRFGLTAVQLHGREPPSDVSQIENEGLKVIKALFQKREPSFQAVSLYRPSAFLLECGKGQWPGGNAQEWNWADAEKITAFTPVILAGGLTPENVGRAISLSYPQAVDVSSGVEAFPGEKDIIKIQAFVTAVDRMTSAESKEETRRIFK
jgi:phosphoribosylanthranilate isomerase